MCSLTRWMKSLVLAGVVLCMGGAVRGVGQSCGATGVAVQVLGSGGPELQDQRASTSYLIWSQGRAVAMVDAGGASALRYGQSGAKWSDIDVFLFSHFHVDHSGDFPALVFSSWFGNRTRPLPVYGPPGNQYMPATTEFVADLFAEPHGAWRYLSEMVEPHPEGTYELQPHNVAAGAETPVVAFRNDKLAAYAVRVVHGAFPALAWRVELGGKRVVFSGDTNGEGDGLTKLAMHADLFVAHNAVPEDATGLERRLHMPPSVIGTTAGNAQVKELVLSHRMLRTLGKEEETQRQIRLHYAGPIAFANDMDCFQVQ